jgi:hypothetical protein
MGPIDEYRQRAEDCLRLARLMPTEHDRRTMLTAARRWHALAGGHPSSCVPSGCGKELSEKVGLSRPATVLP